MGHRIFYEASGKSDRNAEKARQVNREVKETEMVGSQRNCVDCRSPNQIRNHGFGRHK